MTYRQILNQLDIGDGYDFGNLDRAKSAGCAAVKLYDARKFSRAGTVITRLA